MHKKIETDLISLAKQISKMKSGDDVAHFQDKARVLYEKLTVLTVVNKYFSEPEKIIETETTVIPEKEVTPEKLAVTTPIPEAEKVTEPIVETPKNPLKSNNETIDNKEETAKLVDQTVQTIKQEATDIVNKIQDQEPQNIHKDTPKKRATLEDEMKDSIPADVAANMFQKATNLERSLLTQKGRILPEIPKMPGAIPKANIAKKQEIPTHKATTIKPTSGTSINDSIHKQKLQIGLNDRIAFVKHLFNFSQENFNRVLSQLNSFGTEQECKNFLINTIKPEYNWTNDQTEYEERLITLIERKFL